MRQHRHVGGPNRSEDGSWPQSTLQAVVVLCAHFSGRPRDVLVTDLESIKCQSQPVLCDMSDSPAALKFGRWCRGIIDVEPIFVYLNGTTHLSHKLTVQLGNIAYHPCQITYFNVSIENVEGLEGLEQMLEVWADFQPPSEDAGHLRLVF